MVRGVENIPDGLVAERGILFVGNHTRFGMYDMPFLMIELHLRGHNVRAPPGKTQPYPRPNYCLSTVPFFVIELHPSGHNVRSTLKTLVLSAAPPVIPCPSRWLSCRCAA